jgi:hypothetical protein
MSRFESRNLKLLALILAVTPYNAFGIEGEYHLTLSQAEKSIPAFKVGIHDGGFQIYGKIPKQCEKLFSFRFYPEPKGVDCSAPKGFKTIGITISDDKNLGQKCLKQFQGKKCRDDVECTDLTQITGTHHPLPADEDTVFKLLHKNPDKSKDPIECFDLGEDGIHYSKATLEREEQSNLEMHERALHVEELEKQYETCLVSPDRLPLAKEALEALRGIGEIDESLYEERIAVLAAKEKEYRLARNQEKFEASKSAKEAEEKIGSLIRGALKPLPEEAEELSEKIVRFADAHPDKAELSARALSKLASGLKRREDGTLSNVHLARNILDKALSLRIKESTQQSIEREKWKLVETSVVGGKLDELDELRSEILSMPGLTQKGHERAASLLRHIASRYMEQHHSNLAYLDRAEQAIDDAKTLNLKDASKATLDVDKMEIKTLRLKVIVSTTQNENPGMHHEVIKSVSNELEMQIRESCNGVRSFGNNCSRLRQLGQSVSPLLSGVQPGNSWFEQYQQQRTLSILNPYGIFGASSYPGMMTPGLYGSFGLGSSMMMGSPMMGSPMMGSPMMGSPMMGSSMMGSPMMGSPMMGSPMMGSPMMGSPMMGSPMMGSPMMGSPPMWRTF